MNSKIRNNLGFGALSIVSFLGASAAFAQSHRAAAPARGTASAPEVRVTGNACTGKDATFAELIGDVDPATGLQKVARDANDKLQEHLKQQEHYYNEYLSLRTLRNKDEAFKAYDKDSWAAISTTGGGLLKLGTSLAASSVNVSSTVGVATGVVTIAQGLDAYQTAKATLVSSLAKVGAISAEEADSARAENQEKALFALEHLKAHFGEQQAKIFDYAQVCNDRTCSPADRARLLTNKRIEINTGIMLLFGEPVTALSQASIAAGNQAPKPAFPAMEAQALSHDPSENAWPGEFADNYTDHSGWNKMHWQSVKLAKDGAQYQVDNVEYTSEESRWQQLNNDALDLLRGTRSEQGMSNAVLVGNGPVQRALAGNIKPSHDVANAMVDFYTGYVQAKLKSEVEMSAVEYAKLAAAVDNIQRLTDLCNSSTFH